MVEKSLGTQESSNFSEQRITLYPLLREFRKAEMYEAEDKRVAEFAKSCIGYLEDKADPRFRELILDSFFRPEQREVHRPSYQMEVKQILWGVQRQLIKSEGHIELLYPEEYDEAEAWRTGLEWIMSEPDRLRELHNDLTTKVIQTNIPQRYVSIPLITGIFKHVHNRFDYPLKIADFCCSENLGATKLALGLPFKVPEVHYDSKYPGVAYRRGLTEERMFRDILKAPLALDSAVGVDMVDQASQDALEWARSCRYKPSDLMDEVYKAELGVLEEARPAQVSRLVADVTDPELVDKMQLPSHYFNIGFIATGLYLMSQHQQEIAFQNLQKIVAEDGIIIRQDFGYIKRGNFRVYKYMFEKPYQYTAAVTDMKTGETEEYFHYKNGKALAMRLGEKALTDLRQVA